MKETKAFEDFHPDWLRMLYLDLLRVEVRYRQIPDRAEYAELLRMKMDVVKQEIAAADQKESRERLNA